MQRGYVDDGVISSGVLKWGFCRPASRRPGLSACGRAPRRAARARRGRRAARRRSPASPASPRCPRPASCSPSCCPRNTVSLTLYCFKFLCLHSTMTTLEIDTNLKFNSDRVWVCQIESAGAVNFIPGLKIVL